MSASRVALVTGIGRRRIGWHVAEGLAARGHALVVQYRRSAAEAAEAVADWQNRGIECLAVEADLRDEAAVKGLVAKTVERFGRLDVLVNCAAMWERLPLEQVTATEVRAHFEINALGTFLCSQQAGLVMVRQAEGGNIITLGDWATIRPYADYAAYFPSKGAVHALTRSLAVELAARNPAVRVNCIMPGPVLLPADFPEGERRRVIDATLVKREGRPENIVQAVLFLIDNDFVTGVCLPVDGGRSIYAPDSA
jgi:pteridine reductase